MTTVEYWQGSRFVVDWTLVDDAGAPVTTATVTGVASLPGGGNAPMLVSNVSNVYTAAYTVAAPGRHTWKLTAAGAGVGTVEGQFTAQRSLLGLPPITVDPTTDIGFMRLLVSDRDEVDPLLDDADYAALLVAEGSRKLAAAAALETIARSEVLISKKITTQDLSTDGPAVAKALLDSARALRDQAATETTTTTSSAALPYWSFPDPNPAGDYLL